MIRYRALTPMEHTILEMKSGVQTIWGQLQGARNLLAAQKDEPGRDQLVGLADGAVVSASKLVDALREILRGAELPVDPKERRPI